MASEMFMVMVMAMSVSSLTTMGRTACAWIWMCGGERRRVAMDL